MMFYISMQLYYILYIMFSSPSFLNTINATTYKFSKPGGAMFGPLFSLFVFSPCLFCAFSGLDMLATAKSAEEATPSLKVAADFINFFGDLLFDVADMLATAAIAVPALSREVVVADLIDLFHGRIRVLRAPPSGPLFFLCAHPFAVFVEARVIFAVKKSAPSFESAFAFLLPREALAAGRIGDGLTLTVLESALVSKFALSVVAKSAAHFRRAGDRGTDCRHFRRTF